MGLQLLSFGEISDLIHCITGHAVYPPKGNYQGPSCSLYNVGSGSALSTFSLSLAIDACKIVESRVGVASTDDPAFAP